MTHFAYSPARVERPAAGRTVIPWSLAAPVVALGEAVAIAALSWVVGEIYFALAFGSAEAGLAQALFGVFVALAFVTISVSRGHYGLEKFLSKNVSDRTLVAWTAAFLLGLAALFLLKAGSDVSRAGIVGFYVAGLAAVGLWRIGLRRLGLDGLERGWLASRRIMLVGGQADIEGFMHSLRDGHHGLTVVGTASAACDARGRAAAVEQARALRPDGLVLLTAWSDPEAMEDWVDALAAVPATIHLAPPAGLQRFGRLPLGWHSALADLVLVRAPLSPSEQAAKRAFDMATAALALIVLSPLLALTALAIRIDSPGPALFRQPRNGFNHDTFAIYKFRTMTNGEETNGFRQAVPGDKRVTRIGRFLRRWNIDELPQLINVLRGEMSIVGPRPHPIALDDDFAARIARYARRHNMKPGITGWAQVNGHRGPTDTEEKMRARVAHDLHYIDNWSLWLDVKIVLLTVLSRRAFRNAC